jgi:hypothetical protein
MACQATRLSLPDSDITALTKLIEEPHPGYRLASWDLARVRAAAAAVEKRGDVLHTAVAISETDGVIAGFTELAIPGDGTGDAQSY